MNFASPHFASVASKTTALGLAAVLLFFCPFVAHSATRTWNNTSTNANNAGSWTGGLPGSGDIAAFTAATATNNPRLSSSLSLLGITFGASTAGWTFTGTNGGGTETLTIGASGIVSDSANVQTFSGAPSNDLTFVVGASAAFTSNSTGGLTFANSLTSFSIGSNTLTLNGSSTSSNNLIAEVIAGTNGKITKSGTGTWTLSGSNTYTGATTINDGTLSVATIANGSAASGLGQSSNAAANLVLGGGTLQYTGGTASTNRNFTLTAGTTSTIDVSTGATNLTISGASTATTGALTKSGAGTLTLTGTNLYTGATTINNGTLSVATIGNSGVSGNLGAGSSIVLGGGSLDYTGSTASTNRSITLTTGTTSTIDVTSASTNLTMSGSTAATTGGFTKDGLGTLTLSGTNLHSGATTVAAGTLVASGNSSLGATTGNITVNAGGTLSLAGGTNITQSGLLTLNGTGASASTGALHAGGGTGTTSQWTGSTTIATGSTITAADNLLIIGNGATGQFNSTTLTLNATATFNTTAAATVTPVYLPVPSYILDPANIVINSKIVGTGGLTKTGDGALIIMRGTSVANTYSGDTTVQGGTLIVDGYPGKAAISSTNIIVGNSGSGNNDNVILQMGQNASLPATNNIIGTYDTLTDASTSNLTIYEDGLFKMNQASNGFVNLTMKGGHINSGGNNALLTISGTLTNNASAQTSLIENGNLGIGSNKLTINAASGTTSSGIDLQIDSIIQQGALFTATISGTALEKTGAGKVVFTGANTYGGVTDVLNGVLNIQNNTALGQNSTGYAFNDTANGTTVQGTAQLQVQGGITVDRETLTLGGTGGGNGALRNISGDNNYNGYVFLSADSRINSDSGTLTLANPSGVNAGLINGTVAGKNLTLGGSGNTIVNGAMGSFVNNITKDGTGTATLAGNNGYAGATTVSQGNLKITHSNGLSGTGVTVSDGAALQFAQDASNANISVISVSANVTGTGGGNGVIQNLNGSNSYAGNITLAGDSLITASNGSSLTMSGSVTGAGYALTAGGSGNTTYNGVISGTGTNLFKNDTGTTTLGGSSANTFTGTTTINDGALTLNKSSGNALGNGAITIGNGVGAANSASLVLSQSNQIGDTAAVSLQSDGLFNVNGQTETIGSLAGTGRVLLAAGQLIAGGNNNSTSFSGTLAGDSSSVLSKNGTGILSIDGNVNASPGDFAGTLNLNAGGLTINASNAFTGTINVAAGTTLKLSSATVDITNLNFTGTGNIILDFSGTASILNVTNLSIAAGVTINIINWQDATDYFYATNWTGAVQDLTGSTPMNQIIFNSPTWVGNNTKWQSYDDQITPVPEPSTYGALLLGGVGALLGWRRWRQRAKAAPQA